MTHDQFMNLRDGYINHTQANLRGEQSEKPASVEGYMSDGDCLND